MYLCLKTISVYLLFVEKERKSTFLTASEQQEKEARSLFAAQY